MRLGGAAAAANGGDGDGGGGAFDGDGDGDGDGDEDDGDGWWAAGAQHHHHQHHQPHPVPHHQQLLQWLGNVPPGVQPLAPGQQPPPALAAFESDGDDDGGDESGSGESGSGDDVWSDTTEDGWGERSSGGWSEEQDALVGDQGPLPAQQQAQQQQEEEDEPAAATAAAAQRRRRRRRRGRRAPPPLDLAPLARLSCLEVLQLDKREDGDDAYAGVTLRWVAGWGVCVCVCVGFVFRGCVGAGGCVQTKQSLRSPRQNDATKFQQTASRRPRSRASPRRGGALGPSTYTT